MCKKKRFTAKGVQVVMSIISLLQRERIARTCDANIHEVILHL